MVVFIGRPRWVRYSCKKNPLNFLIFLYSLTLHVFMVFIFFRHGLYKGWLPVVSSLCCSNFVYFYVYSSLKAMSLKGGHKPNPAQHLGFAFIAGKIILYGYVYIVQCCSY